MTRNPEGKWFKILLMVEKPKKTIFKRAKLCHLCCFGCAVISFLSCRLPTLTKDCARQPAFAYTVHPQDTDMIDGDHDGKG